MYVCGCWSLVAHCSDAGLTPYVTPEHCSLGSVTVTPKSGMPVTAPAASAHCVMSSKFWRSSTPVPIRAKLSLHAWRNPARASSPLSFGSTCLTTILRPATHVFLGLQLLLT